MHDLYIGLRSLSYGMCACVLLWALLYVASVFCVCVVFLRAAGATPALILRANTEGAAPWETSRMERARGAIVAASLALHCQNP